MIRAGVSLLVQEREHRGGDESRGSYVLGQPDVMTIHIHTYLSLLSLEIFVYYYSVCRAGKGISASQHLICLDRISLDPVDSYSVVKSLSHSNGGQSMTVIESY